MATPVALARRTYGAHPAHLVLVVAGFVVAVYVVFVIGLSTLWNPDVWWQSIIVWFIAAAIVHDLVLFPAYATGDRVLTGVVKLIRRAGGRRGREPLVPVLNFIRIPVLAAGLVTLIFLPGIIAQGKASYLRATGQTQEPFLQRWLLLCLAILVLGAIAYAVTVLVARSHPRVAPTAPVPVAAPAAVQPVPPVRVRTADPTPAKTFAISAGVSLGVVVVYLAMRRAVESRRR